MCINQEKTVQDALNLWKYFFNAAKVFTTAVCWQVRHFAQLKYRYGILYNW